MFNYLTEIQCSTISKEAIVCILYISETLWWIMIENLSTMAQDPWQRIWKLYIYTYIPRDCCTSKGNVCMQSWWVPLNKLPLTKRYLLTHLRLAIIDCIRTFYVSSNVLLYRWYHPMQKVSTSIMFYEFYPFTYAKFSITLLVLISCFLVSG